MGVADLNRHDREGRETPAKEALRKKSYALKSQNFKACDCHVWQTNHSKWNNIMLNKSYIIFFLVNVLKNTTNLLILLRKSWIKKSTDWH